ncbi:unnamed protein product [Caenorhabditis auriculariae]|uniref:Uncharacterized protein n=1 Tax=Caenorhabditis auriculariae TaxID=2777116 RepID=A0A8S1HW06_9PELO|nr:unnamed protein product [Caenorhabditis auriculariae]
MEGESSQCEADSSCSHSQLGEMTCDQNPGVIVVKFEGRDYRHYQRRKERSCQKRIAPQSVEDRRKENAKNSRAYTTRNKMEIDACRSRMPILESEYKGIEEFLVAVFTDSDVGAEDLCA